MIGFRGPFFLSWGKILNKTWSPGGFSLPTWWWTAPPMMALPMLALRIVFIGRTLEEVLIPRLRRR